LYNVENILNDSSDVLRERESIEEGNIISSNKSDNIKKTELKRANSHDKVNTILCVSSNHSTTIENTLIFLCKI